MSDRTDPEAARRSDRLADAVTRLEQVTQAHLKREREAGNAAALRDQLAAAESANAALREALSAARNDRAETARRLDSAIADLETLLADEASAKA